MTTRSHACSARTVALLAMAACTLAIPTTASAQRASTIHTVFIQTSDSAGSSQAVDKRLVYRIERAARDSGLRVVSDPKSADATIRVKAVVWPEGTYVTNVHSGATSVSDYQGYASVELLGHGDEPLWSYLATPSRLHLASLTSNLADQIYDGLQLALKSGIATSTEAAVTGPGAVATLRGAGATFPAPLYRRWFEAYAEHAGGTPIAYDATGSSGGLEQLAAGKVDFAASDIPSMAAQMPAESGLLRLPTVIGGVVPIFNLPGFKHGLNLTPEALAAIYAGKVRRWNDPQLRALNRGAALPNAEIVVVHRSDGSGTTFVWTSFLATASPEWKSMAGASVTWPVGDGEAGNEGVADKVQSTPYAIGYTELTFAIQHQLSYASVRNPAGLFIHADLPSLVAAAQSAGGNSAGPKGSSLLNEPGANSYPITTYTYFLVPRKADARKTAAIAEFLRWMLTSGQKECSSLGYAPLPHDAAESELAELKTLQ